MFARAGGYTYPNGVKAGASYRNGVSIDPMASEKIDAVLQSLASQAQLGSQQSTVMDAHMYAPACQCVLLVACRSL